MAKKVLVTGAGGFIGGFIVEEGLRRGYEMWAAVRATTSRKYLADERIRFIELDFDDSDELKAELSKCVAENGKWDYIVYNLGATKCANFMDFNAINFGYLKKFIDAIKELNILPEGFLMMSSLGAVGMGDELNYTPLSPSMIPNPNTRYGLSKLKAETYLQMQEGLPYIIFRPTGVYGPHEKDYFLMIKSIQKGFDFSVGSKKQMLTFIYVKDLVNAIYDALEAGAKRKAYFISEDRAYTQEEFRKIVADELGKKHVMAIKCPISVLYVVSVIAEKIGQARLKPSTLNRDKFKIMKQRNWCCDISDAKKDFNFSPKYSLKDGVKEAIEWYRANGWLK